MELKCSPDIAQEVMKDIFRHIDGTDVNIGDVAAFTKGGLDDYFKFLDKILGSCTVPNENGFSVSPLKCEWRVKETHWLGFWLTPTGLKSWKKKIDTILQMEPPKNIKQMRSFLEAVNYYWDLWPGRAHVLKPLSTYQTELVHFFCLDRGNGKSFQGNKSSHGSRLLNEIFHHNLPFKMHADVSDYQMGTRIMQQGVPVAYWSRKLCDAHKNYTTTNKNSLEHILMYILITEI